MKIPQFNLECQFRYLKEEILKVVEQILASGRYILGPEVEAFEKEVANYLGVKHAIGVASGTDALWLSLKALGVGPGDLVLTTPFTFFATASAILNTGATPVFADIDPLTFNLDPEKVKEALEGRSPVWQRLGLKPEKVKVILPVHLYGQAADMDALLEIARQYDLKVVEDAAQAMGTKYKGQKVGSFGEFGCFSFFPTKNLGAFGDGGLVVTQDDELAGKVRMLRAHGSKPKYYHHLVGTNSRLDAIQAAILRVKLPHLDKWIEARRNIANIYDSLLGKVEKVKIPYRASYSYHTFHQYTLRILNDQRDELRSYLKEKGIGTGIYYPLPVHLQPVLKPFGYMEGDFPEAEKACKEVLSLPMWPELTEDEARYVAQTVKDYFIGATP